MADRIIQTADLSIIERNLQIVGNKLQDLEDSVAPEAPERRHPDRHI